MKDIVLLKCIGDETRLKILKTLIKRERCVCEIISSLNVEQTLVSHHLKVLRNCGILKSRREGKKVFDEMAAEYHSIRPARELIIDRGSEFGAHRARGDLDWESEFKAHVTAYGTKVILIRKKHPQSNGKIERWFETYYAHREAFASFEDFVKWYNDRPHGSLDFENIETPNEAFWRRLPPENLLGIASRMFGW